MLLRKSVTSVMSLTVCCMLTQASLAAEPGAPAPIVEAVNVTDVADGGGRGSLKKLTQERSQRAVFAHDPAFDIYVPSSAIADAWYECHPAKLTDVALQLAEGERVLLRSRKGMSAAQLIKLALNASIQAQDQESVDRIARHAKETGNSELTALAASAKLAGVPRSAEAPIMVAVEEVSALDFVQLQIYLRDIHKATLTGDSRCLCALEADAGSCIPEQFRVKIGERIAAAKATIPEGQETDESLIAALDVLTKASRMSEDQEDQDADQPTQVTGSY